MIVIWKKRHLIVFVIGNVEIIGSGRKNLSSLSCLIKISKSFCWTNLIKLLTHLHRRLHHPCVFFKFATLNKILKNLFTNHAKPIIAQILIWRFTSMSMASSSLSSSSASAGFSSNTISFTPSAAWEVNNSYKYEIPKYKERRDPQQVHLSKLPSFLRKMVSIQPATLERNVKWSKSQVVI